MSMKAEDETTYEVAVHREGRWWVFDIPVLGAAGQAAEFSEIETEARGIIAAWDEDSPAYEDVRVKVRLDEETAPMATESEWEARWPELFEELDESQREAVVHSLVAGWHEGWNPTREEVANLADYTRGVIDWEEYEHRSHALSVPGDRV